MDNGYIITQYNQNGDVKKIEHYYNPSDMFKYIQNNINNEIKDKYTIHEVGKCVLDVS